MWKKAVLITGCDSGFGYSLACHMAENHPDFVTIACCYESDSEGAQDLKAKNIKVFRVDVTDTQSVDQLKKNVENFMEETNCRLWTLVNNAATLVFADAIWQTNEMFKKQMDVNVFGCWLMSKIFMPELMSSKGRLVNMISFCTECPLPTLSIYTASKAALLSMSNGMRMELAKYEVDVVLFNPGDHPGETPLCYGQGANYELMSREVLDRFAVKHPQVLDSFEAYKGKFVQDFASRPPLMKLNSPGLYKNFDAIISDIRPKRFYVNSDWKTRAFFGFLNVIPKSWSDKLRIAIMRLPK